MDIEKIKQEIVILAKSFILAVATGAAISALQWLGAHIPDALKLLGPGSVAWASLKHSYNNVALGR